MRPLPGAPGQLRPNSKTASSYTPSSEPTRHANDEEP
jgi:hypothetical protein